MKKKNGTQHAFRSGHITCNAKTSIIINFMLIGHILHSHLSPITRIMGEFMYYECHFRIFENSFADMMSIEIWMCHCSNQPATRIQFYIAKLLPVLGDFFFQILDFIIFSVSCSKNENMVNCEGYILVVFI